MAVPIFFIVKIKELGYYINEIIREALYYMEYLIIGWLVLFILFIVFELITMKLITIWFSGGTLVAFILSVFEVYLVIQLAAFVVVTLLLLIARPCAKSFINKAKSENTEITENTEQ